MTDDEQRLAEAREFYRQVKAAWPGVEVTVGPARPRGREWGALERQAGRVHVALAMPAQGRWGRR